MVLSLTEALVDSMAPNLAASKNARALILKGNFLRLNKSSDGALLFGACLGSGSSAYQCSSDFIDPGRPVHRCTCPSRQFPCKHCLGLMYAFVQGKKFEVADIPDDVLDHREKVKARTEKRNEKRNDKRNDTRYQRASAPRKVNKTALAKKIKAQRRGLDLLETLTFDLTRLGMGNTSARTAAEIEEQAKQLGNAYLPGAQAALRAYTMLFSDEEGRVDSALSATARDRVYGEAMAQLTRLHALVRLGREYLQKRLDHPELAPDTDTSIAAWLGHAWQLAELKAAGLFEPNAELVQLAFNSHDDIARREYVDTGIWMNLGSGRIQLTQTLRPYRAAKFIKRDDSFFQIACVPELCIYPGDTNPRIRWDGMTPRAPTPGDYERIRQHARQDMGALIKEVKNTLRLPLADRHPIYAVHFRRIGAIGDETVVEAPDEQRLVMTDAGMVEEPASVYLLELLPPRLLGNQVLVGRFRHDLDERQLRIKPLAIVTTNQVVRLTL